MTFVSFAENSILFILVATVYEVFIAIVRELRGDT